MTSYGKPLNHRYFNVCEVKNFEVHKKNLINLIDKIPNTSRRTDREKLSHTDWALPETMKREYIDYFIDNIYEDYASQLCRNFNCQRVKINNIWFQKYNTGDFHKEHRHAESHFTNVFYLQLPEENLNTHVYDLNNQPIPIYIQEGDILTFPAFLSHESVVNKSKDSKIIISFNTTIDSGKINDKNKYV